MISRAPASFDQVLSDKLHSTLVIRPAASKKIIVELLICKDSSSALPPSTSADRSSLIRPVVKKIQRDSIPPGTTTNPENVNTVAIPPQDPIIIRGTKEKKRILSDYQDKFGSNYPDSIITRKKGKPSCDGNLSENCARRRMRPSLDKWYRVSDLYLYNVITTVLKEQRLTFDRDDLASLRLVKISRT